MLTNTTNGSEPKAADYRDMPLYEIAATISREWRNVYFGAKPYLSAMHSLTYMSDSYGMDDGRSIVAYFLANATTWRGPVAKAIKAELNRRYKAK